MEQKRKGNWRNDERKAENWKRHKWMKEEIKIKY